MSTNIIYTVITRLSIALGSLFMIVLTSNVLGSEGTGTVSLILLGISISALISGFAGGGASVFLAPRYGSAVVFQIAYFWAVISTVIVTFALHIFSLIPPEYTIHIGILSLINAFNVTNQVILLGKEKIKNVNLSVVVQSFFSLTSLAILFTMPENRIVFSYIVALYIGYLVNFVVSSRFVWPILERKEGITIKDTVRQAFRLGFFTQTATLSQMLSYRLSYYFIDFWFGRSSLGIYAVAVQLSEGIWLICKSIGMVQYGRISNMDNKAAAARLSASLFRVSIISTAMLVIPIIMLPDSVFTFLFGSDFVGVSQVILIMSPGIIFVSAQTILSHYCSGMGNHHINMFASATALVVTAVSGLLLIPVYGKSGAAITASIAYFSAFFVHYIQFNQTTQEKLFSLTNLKNDFKKLLRRK